MTPKQKEALYEQLSQPFPKEAIERTDGRQTGKGYTTTGIKAQFIINRLNEVLGIGGWRTHRKIAVRELTTNSGRKAYEAVCSLDGGPGPGRRADQRPRIVQPRDSFHADHRS